MKQYSALWGPTTKGRTRGSKAVLPFTGGHRFVYGLAMIKNPKVKGRKLEYKTMRWLEEKGCRCTRSGGSLGVWDIIGISPNMVYLVQVKANRWPGTEEMDKMKTFSVPGNCSKEVWRWDDHGKSVV